jgi:recombinational DNA repair ATPase RecF
MRNLQEGSLELSPSMNVFHGINGSGKTSMLEVFHVLAVGRSFRTTRLNRVVHTGGQQFAIAADVQEDSGRSSRMGMQWEGGQRRLRLNGTWIDGHWEIASRVPLLVMHANSVDDLLGSPEERRRLMDWGAFFLFRDFPEVWKRWRRAHEQRNAALRDRNFSSASAFAQVAAESGTKLTAMRREFIHQLSAASLHEALEPLWSSFGLSHASCSTRNSSAPDVCVQKSGHDRLRTCHVDHAHVPVRMSHAGFVGQEDLVSAQTPDSPPMQPFSGVPSPSSACRSEFQWKPILDESCHENSDDLLAETLPRLNGMQLIFRQGWPDNETLQDAYARSAPSDMERGFGQIGPHRADFALQFGGRSVREASRGEQKRILYALVISQGLVLSSFARPLWFASGNTPVDSSDPVATPFPRGRLMFLLDDLLAELDEEAAHAILLVIRRMNWQAVLTSLNKQWSHSVLDVFPDTFLYQLERGCWHKM